MPRSLEEYVEYSGPKGRRYVLVETFRRVKAERDTLRAEGETAQIERAEVRS